MSLFAFRINISEMCLTFVVKESHADSVSETEKAEKLLVRMIAI